MVDELKSLVQTKVLATPERSTSSKMSGSRGQGRRHASDASRIDPMIEYVNTLSNASQNVEYQYETHSSSNVGNRKTSSEFDMKQSDTVNHGYDEFGNPLVEINGVVMNEAEIQDAIERLERIKNGLRGDSVPPNGSRANPQRRADVDALTLEELKNRGGLPGHHKIDNLEPIIEEAEGGRSPRSEGELNRTNPNYQNNERAYEKFSGSVLEKNGDSNQSRGKNTLKIVSVNANKSLIK